NLAVTYDSLAALHERSGDPTAARRYGELAIRTEERLCALDPESVDYHARLVQALLNLSHTHAENEDPEQALRSLLRADKVVARLVRLVPRDDHVASLAAQVDRAAGEALRDLGRHEEALERLVRSVDRLAAIVARAADPEPW